MNRKSIKKSIRKEILYYKDDNIEDILRCCIEDFFEYHIRKNSLYEDDLNINKKDFLRALKETFNLNDKLISMALDIFNQQLFKLKERNEKSIYDLFKHYL